jgi:hypothetical protein
MSNFLLDLTDDAESSFAPVPKGTYQLCVTDADEVVTKAGNKRINLTFSITAGEYAGRKIWEGYNLTGENTKAVQISRGQLKSLWKCAGHSDFRIESAQSFLGIEISASVKIQEGKNGYEDKNVISTFKPKAKTSESSDVPF